MIWAYRQPSVARRGPKAILALTGIAALLPVACVLWFMTRAIRNEHLAVQQRLTEIYTNHLSSVERRLTAFWRARQEQLTSRTDLPPPQRFAALARSDVVDSLIIVGPDRELLYPIGFSTPTGDSTPVPKSWTKAQALEFEHADYAAAAEAYRGVVEAHDSVSWEARALQSQANCLLQAGQKESALLVLQILTASRRLHNAIGCEGTLVVPNAQLRLLRMVSNPQDDRYQTTLLALIARLNDYGDSRLHAPQRRFLMEETVSFTNENCFPTLAPERLAADYLERVKSVPRTNELLQTELPGVFHLATADGSVVGLYRSQRVQEESAALIRTEFALPGAQIRVVPPDGSPPAANSIDNWPAGACLPGWRLSLSFGRENPFTAASRRQTATYLSTGALGLVTFAFLAFVIAHHLTAQMRLVRLRSDLVSTVSHELKTPLTSMRVLVETLLAGRCASPEQVREYLQLIAQENERLSRLIERFLTFSRLERGRQRFCFENLRPENIAADALTALRERLQAPGCSFTMHCASDLPVIHGDAEALTTVLINLLENAWKYTPDPKRIRLNVHANENSVYFEVIDNGVGLSSDEVKRVFDQFYQVDQTLTREHSGCGLGLSIVQSIVRAHQGTVGIESEPGHGSVFRVSLPLAGPARQG